MLTAGRGAPARSLCSDCVPVHRTVISASQHDAGKELSERMQYQPRFAAPSSQCLTHHLLPNRFIAQVVRSNRSNSRLAAGGLASARCSRPDRRGFTNPATRCLSAQRRDAPRYISHLSSMAIFAKNTESPAKIHSQSQCPVSNATAATVVALQITCHYAVGMQSRRHIRANRAGIMRWTFAPLGLVHLRL